MRRRSWRSWVTLRCFVVTHATSVDLYVILAHISHVRNMALIRVLVVLRDAAAQHTKHQMLK